MGFPEVFGTPYVTSVFTGWGANLAENTISFPDLRPLVTGLPPATLPTLPLNRETAPVLVGGVFLTAADLARNGPGGLGVKRGEPVGIPPQVFDYVGEAMGLGIRSLLDGYRVEFPLDLTLAGGTFFARLDGSRLAVVVSPPDHLILDIRVDLATGEVTQEITPPLQHRRCVACEGGIPALGDAAIARLVPEVPGWEVRDDQGLKHLRRFFRFRDFKATMAFVNIMAGIAENEGHHPNFRVHSWNCVDVEIYTHAIGGLSENDFILAAKINGIGGWLES